MVKDEYLHLNYGQEWLKENLSTCKDELMKANKVNLPLIKKMLDEVADDASVLAMDREELMEEFMIAYQDTLMEIGLDNSCLLYTSPSPRDREKSRMPSSA